MNPKADKVKVEVPVPKDETEKLVETYRPDVTRCRTSKNLVYGAIPADVFSDRRIFIETSRKGIPGHWVKSVITETGMRETFLTLLNVASGNLSSRVYQRKALEKEASEEVLDAVRLIRQAEDVWESRDMAIQWLKSPVPALDGKKPTTLFDTFEGREWVSQVLTKIEHGDFT